MVQSSPVPNFITFSSPQKETQYPIAVISPSSHSLGTVHLLFPGISSTRNHTTHGVCSSLSSTGHSASQGPLMLLHVSVISTAASLVAGGREGVSRQLRPAHWYMSGRYFLPSSEVSWGQSELVALCPQSPALVPGKYLLFSKRLVKVWLHLLYTLCTLKCGLAHTFFSYPKQNRVHSLPHPKTPKSHITSNSPLRQLCAILFVLINTTFSDIRRNDWELLGREISLSPRFCCSWDYLVMYVRHRWGIRLLGLGTRSGEWSWLTHICLRSPKLLKKPK